MPERMTTAALVEKLLAEDGRMRRCVAIAGAPGSGKSTISEDLKKHINAVRPGYAEILMMDGYHFDDMVLDAHGHSARKGTPHTFDLDGFRNALERLSMDDGCDVAVPVFDRSIEIARAGASILHASTRIILAEGNYLLLDEPGWRDLNSLFDITVMVETDENELIERMMARWRSFGYDPTAIQAKMEGNNLPNMRLVLTNSRLADVIIRSNPGD